MTSMSGFPNVNWYKKNWHIFGAFYTQILSTYVWSLLQTCYCRFQLVCWLCILMSLFITGTVKIPHSCPMLGSAHFYQGHRVSLHFVFSFSLCNFLCTLKSIMHCVLLLHTFKDLLFTCCHYVSELWLFQLQIARVVLSFFNV